MPAKRGRSAPVVRTTGRASSGDSVATPKNAPNAPTRTGTTCPPTMPSTTAAADSAVSTSPMTTRLRETRVRSTATCRIAATGAIRPRAEPAARLTRT